MPSTQSVGRRWLRRPDLIVLVLFLMGLVFVLRELVFDSQSTFKLVASRTPATNTVTVWATTTVAAVSTPSALGAHEALGMPDMLAQGNHKYRADGLLDVNPDGPHPIFELVERAQAAWAEKVGRASTTLSAAVAEYERRYKRPPPRGFDEWWNYVQTHAVQLPDEYDQINRDLEPFWGVHPKDMQRIQQDWEAHVDSFTMGKDAQEDQIDVLNVSLPGDEERRLSFLRGGFDVIDLLANVEHHIPPFRAVFSPHDGPGLSIDHELRTLTLEAAATGKYIDMNNLPPQKSGWLSGCSPFSPAALQYIHFLSPNDRADTSPPPLPPSHPRTKSFIHNPLAAMDPCLHPDHLTSHGVFTVLRAGPAAQRTPIPMFSLSSTLLHSDIRIAHPLGWRSPSDPPPLPWSRKLDSRLEWRGQTTGLGNMVDWRTTVRIRLAALASGTGSVNVTVLRPPLVKGARVGEPEEVDRRRYLSSLLDAALVRQAFGCEPEQCAIIEELFEFRRWHPEATAAMYKYVLDVDGNGWSSRFKRLLNSGSLIFKASMYPEWFQDRIAPWVHYIPIQNDYSDLLDALVFFRGDPSGLRAHEDMAERIATAGRDWSVRYWRMEDLTAYMFRLFLEYARVMSPDRDNMSFVMEGDKRPAPELR